MLRGTVFLLVVAVMGVLTIETERPARAAGPDCNAPWNRPDGLLIKHEHTSGQFLVENCSKRPFVSALDLGSHNLGQYATASAEEVAALGTGPQIRAREGTVFRYPPNTGTRYIIDEVGPGFYHKRAIDISAWNAYFAPCPGGYAGAIIEVSDPNFLVGYLNGSTLYSSSLRPDGQLIYSGSGAQYLLVNGVKQPFASEGALTSYALTQPLCTASVGAYSTGDTLKAREGTLFKSGGSSAQYVIERQPTSYWKKATTSLDSLTFFQLHLKTLHTWSDVEVAGYGNANHVHPYKSLFAGTWIKNLVYEDLTANVQYLPPTAPGSWDPAIGGAEGAWNAAPIWPDFINWPTLPADVEIKVGPVPNVSFAGEVTFSWSSGYVQRATLKLNTSQQPSLSQSVTAHELGHVLLLAHDGVNPDGPDGDNLEDLDGKCGNQPTGVYRVPQTILDPDCYVSFGHTGPVNWDYCGANHKFHSSGVWNGC